MSSSISTSLSFEQNNACKWVVGDPNIFDEARALEQLTAASQNTRLAVDIQQIAFGRADGRIGRGASGSVYRYGQSKVIKFVVIGSKIDESKFRNEVSMLRRIKSFAKKNAEEEREEKQIVPWDIVPYLRHNGSTYLGYIIMQSAGAPVARTILLAVRNHALNNDNTSRVKLMETLRFAGESATKVAENLEKMNIMHMDFTVFNVMFMQKEGKPLFQAIDFERARLIEEIGDERRLKSTFIGPPDLKEVRPFYDASYFFLNMNYYTNKELRKANKELAEVRRAPPKEHASDYVENLILAFQNSEKVYWIGVGVSGSPEPSVVRELTTASFDLVRDL